MTGDHTLVIPTLNRPALLKQLVRYYYKRAWPVNLLVLDSSMPEIARENSEALAPFGNAVRHVVFETTEPWASKLLRGLEMVESRYVSFCADDDVVFPVGVQNAIAYLDSHAEYVGAHGIYFNFRPDGRLVHVKNEYSGPSNEATHPGARIFRLCQKYQSLFYAVYRTQDLRDIFASLQTLNTFLFQELFQSVAAVIKGKIKRLPSIYAARQYGPPAESNRKKWNPFPWFADNPVDLLEHYQGYRDALWAFYRAHSSAPHIDQEAFFKTLDLAHAVYFCSGCSPRDFHAVLQPLWPGDPYLMIGPLDALRVADKLMAFKRSAYPEGDTGADMIEQLQTPAGISKWSKIAALSTLRYLWLVARSVPNVVRLDLKARIACRTAWKCRLPLTARWLVAVPEFGSTYHELCHYLDAS
ncbi:MAG TPA: TIGR00180 family glycosyltransferase [Burkholderiales bacterium]|nr:TIGR00180 family glycosyltransferase [Burkholderiales bacterium]